MAQDTLLHETGQIGTDAAPSEPRSYFPLLVQLPVAIDVKTEIVLQFPTITIRAAASATIQRSATLPRCNA